MSKLKFVLLAARAISFAALVSCSKNNNNTPASSSKDTVLYSNWIPLKLVLTGNTADSDYEQKITASALTTTVLSKGLVLIYANETGSGGQYVNYVSDFGIYPTFASQAIYLDAYGTYGYNISLNTVVDSVRYVIIPGTVNTTSASGNLQTYTPSQLKGLDYSTLTKVLNIPAHGSTFH